MLRMRVEAFLVAPFLGFLPEVVGLPLSATAVKFGLVLSLLYQHTKASTLSALRADAIV